MGAAPRSLGDRELVFASTHVDTNAGSWLPSAKVLHQELDRIAGKADVVLVGDFNCAAGGDAHQYLLTTAGFRDAWREAGNSDDGIVTYHGFTGATRLQHGEYPADAAAHGNYRIDWILVRGQVISTAAEIDYRRDGDLLPSDHYPLLADLD